MDDPEVGRSSTLRRRVGEGITILVSILLAFGIDAWWDTWREDATLQGHLAAVLAEMEGNRRALLADATRISRAASAQRAILGLTGPAPRALPEDSLAGLIGASFDGVPGILTTGALESLLASGTLASVSDVELQARLLNWRGRYESIRAQAGVFQAGRASLIETLGDGLPLLDAAHVVDPGLPSSSFRFDVGALLSDPRLEAHVANLGALSARMDLDLDVLIRLTDEVLDRLGG